MGKLELAAAAYDGGATCSQAVVAAYAEDAGVEAGTALALAEGLGGGIGGRQDACGAVTAMAAVVSWKANRAGLGRAGVYAAVSGACKRFEETHGSIRCADIMGGGKPFPHCCPHVVRTAIECIEEFEAQPQAGDKEETS